MKRSLQTKAPRMAMLMSIAFCCIAIFCGGETATAQVKMKSGELISATPISIPRFARLHVYDPSDKVAGMPIPIPKPEMDTDTAIPAPPGAGPDGGRGINPGRGPLVPPPALGAGAPKVYGIGKTSPGQAVGGMQAMQDAVVACELLRQRNDRLDVRIHYAVDAARKRPVYAGAWLFGPGGKDVGVGYTPVALPADNKSSVNVVLSLPPKEFETAYIQAMLIQSGSVIAEEQFAAPYVWNADPASAPSPSAAALTSHEQLQGAWKAELFGQSVEYIFTADGADVNNPAKFQWRCDAFQQVAKGVIQPGNRINARWTDAGGAVSDSALVELDAQGKAVKMTWGNGVVMTRNAN